MVVGGARGVGVCMLESRGGGRGGGCKFPFSFEITGGMMA
jgi:hypothetical protein